MTMSSTTLLASAAAAARIALAEAVVLKVGQVLQAIVAATDSAGVTTLKLGSQTVEAQLPQPLPPGTTLQLQVKVGGATPQLAIVGQTPPAVAGAAAPARGVAASVPPMPQGAVTLGLEQMPEPKAPPTVAGMRLAPASPTTPQIPAPQIVESVQPLAVLGSDAESAARPAPVAPSAQPLTFVATPVAEVPPLGGAAGAQVAGAVSAVTNSPALPVPDFDGVTAAAPLTAAPVQLEETVAVPPSVSPPMPTSAPGVSSAPVGLALEPAPPLGTPAVASGPPPPAGPDGAAPPQPVAGLPAAPVAQAPLVEPGLEPEAPNPLLLAQAAARPVVAAEVPQAFTGPPATAAQTAGPALSPPTPAAALAQMVPDAIARQASAGPLLQTLADAVAQPQVLPEPVLRAAMGVLAQRIVAPDGRVSPEAIAQAVTRSGIGLEASLARGMPQPMDAKAGLLALRDALSKWLGDTPAAPAPQARTPGDAPPLKGLPLRAIAADPPSLPDAARDAGRLLHEQTDSAISRVKLMQLASLADPQTNSARPSSPSLRMELPFLIGHELVMAQMQVGRDGGSRREAASKRGWSMRFALNFSATGEVGAEVGLLGRAVSVALWAAEPETAAAMRETLPELARALEAVGLMPNGLKVRGGVPEPERPASGQVLDSVS